MDAIVANRILRACVLAWALAQGSKLFTSVARRRRVSMRHLLSAGGMPSAHSAVVVALATRVAIQQGLTSPLFAMAAVFAVIVMYDAAGVRRAVSIQARILNRIMTEMIEGQRLDEERLRELIGHTPFEVFVGALLGALAAMS